MKKKGTFHGIQVYEILEHGNVLHAIYANTELLQDENCAGDNENTQKKKYSIDTEIARKKDYDTEGVEGVYCCRYMETTSLSVIECELKIENCEGVYEFTWLENNKPIWKGLGLMTGTSHISVSYVAV